MVQQFRLHADRFKVHEHGEGSQGITSAWLTTAGNTHKKFIPVQHADRSDTQSDFFLPVFVHVNLYLLAYARLMGEFSYSHQQDIQGGHVN